MFPGKFSMSEYLKNCLENVLKYSCILTSSTRWPRDGPIHFGIWQGSSKCANKGDYNEDTQQESHFFCQGILANNCSP